MVSLLLAGACGGGKADESSGANAPTDKPAGGAADGKTIKIGGLWAMTGIVQSFGKNSSAVLKFAVDEINAEGGAELADGSRAKLEPMIYDEGCPTAETGIAAARKASADPVMIIIGPTCSSTAEPVFGLLQKTLDDAGDSGIQVPIFTDTAIKAGLAKISPWAFRNTPSEVEMYQGLFAHLKETSGLKTIAFGTEVDFAHSKGTADGAMKPGAKDAGFQVVADEGWKLADTDFSTQASKIRNAKPDIVAIAAHPFTTCGFLKELKRQAVKPKALVALTSSLTAETLDGCGADAQGMIGPTSFAPVTADALAASEKVAKEYQGFIDLHSAPVLENLRLLKSLFKSSGIEAKPETLASDRRKLRDAIEGVTEFDGLLGKIKFRHDLGGEVEKPWVVVRAKGEEFVVDFVPVQFEDLVKTEK
ncbi:MAG: ABC transporter substrate-binding protein [Acidimicrobiia bacterium]